MFDPKMTVVPALIACVFLATPSTSAFDDPPVDGDQTEAAPAADAPADAPLATAPATVDQARYLDSSLHYILIAKPDLVASSIQALFDSGISDEQIAQLIDERGIRERVERALTRGRSMEGCGELVAQLESRMQAGARATSRNALRIEEAVKDLGGSMRQQMIARGRLIAAGEYAVPALLNALTSNENPKLSTAVRGVLVDIKRLAVGPLCAALPSLDPGTQRKVCEILGEIGYPTAQPYLLALSSGSDAASDVRDAAMRAYARLGGTSSSAASQFQALAKRYLDQTPSLIPFAGDAVNPVWEFTAEHGLVGTEVPTGIYCETMAMQAARESLRLDASSDAALAVYVAADLRRAGLMRLLGISTESSTEEDAPVVPSILTSKFSAEFFATASGARIGQMVLGMAIDANDPMLARAAIGVLAATGSASALVTPESGRSPLIECLSFADRRVRFDAALALALAMPQVSFEQDSLVIPVLSSMVQSGGLSGAAIAGTEEDRSSLASRMNAVGVTSVTTGGSFSEADGKVAPGQTMDLVVIQGSRESINEAVRAVRVSRSGATAPIVVISSGNDASALSLDFEGDPRVSVFLSMAPEGAFAQAVQSAFGAAGGIELSADQAGAYSTQALEAIKLLARTGSPVFDVRECESTLISALAIQSGDSRLLVGSVLALLPTDSAQRALMDGALASEGEAQAQLLMGVATSARRIGNLLAPRQIESLRSLIQNTTGPVADAAGQAYGALGLSSAEVVSLITTPAK